MPKKSDARFWSFVKAFRHHWFTALSGCFSVPFTVLTVYSGDKYAQSIFGVLAFSSFAYSSYQVWKVEREAIGKLSDDISTLEERLRPKIELRFDHKDDNCLHSLDGRMFAHLFVYNLGELGIPECEVMLEEVMMADEDDVYKRVEKYRTALTLAWSRVNDHRKYAPITLPPGKSLVDFASGESMIGFYGKNATPIQRSYFKVAVSPDHSQFTQFGQKGRYLLMVKASSPNTSSKPLKLLVEWNGKPNEMKVTNVSSQHFRIGNRAD
jgi:hypothetical protein